MSARGRSACVGSVSLEHPMAGGSRGADRLPQAHADYVPRRGDQLSQ
jgi:hypothetical protein